jgi:hypothetical protein
MASLILSNGFNADLLEIATRDKPTAVYLAELIREISESERILFDLCKTNGIECYQPSFNTVSWGTMVKNGFSLWRIKPTGFTKTRACKYRIIYGYDGRTDIYYVLGIMERGVDYDISSAFGQRIIDDYRKLELPGC